MSGFVESAGSRFAMSAITKAAKALARAGPREALVKAIVRGIDPQFRMTSREIRRLNDFVARESTWPWLVKASVRVDTAFVGAIEEAVLREREEQQRTTLAHQIANLARAELPGAVDLQIALKILSEQIRQTGDLQADLPIQLVELIEAKIAETTARSMRGGLALANSAQLDHHGTDSGGDVLAVHLSQHVLQACLMQINPLRGTPEILCRDLRSQPASRQAYPSQPPWFYFRAFLVDRGGPNIVVDAPTLQDWLGRVEEEPVNILAIWPTGRAVKIWMICLHDWVIKKAAQTSGTRWDQPIEFSTKDFMGPLDPNGHGLHGKLCDEADRVTRSVGAPWRTLRDYGLLPIDEATFLEFMEVARFLEMPTQPFSRLQRASKGRLAASLRRYLLTNGAEQDTLTEEWLNLVGELPLPHHTSSTERTEFRRFVRLVRQPQGKIVLPPYHGLEVGCWRSFVAMYPESVEGLAHVIQTRPAGNRRAGDNVAFAAAMLPMLALSTDRFASTRAREVLADLDGRLHDWPQYHIRRELLRAPVEAGAHRSEERLLGLVRKEGRESSREARFLTGYGWTAELVEQNIIRKLDRPTLRDEQLRRFYEVMGEVVRPASRV